MARILEALKRVDGKRRARLEVPHPEQEDHAERDEFSFIEVGGPEIDGSQNVLAVPVPQSLLAEPASSLARPANNVAVAFQPVSPATETEGPIWSQELIAGLDPEHPCSQQYRAVLAGLNEKLPQGGSRVLLFSAAGSSSATASVVLNLAITCAAQGNLRVAAVDACPQRPAVSALLGLPETPGLCEVLAESVPLEWALQETCQPQLKALTAGNAALLGRTTTGKAWRTLLRHMRKRFDMIFIDGPTWHPSADLLALATACEAVYLVLPQDEAELSEVQELMHALPRQGVSLHGCLLTQA